MIIKVLILIYFIGLFAGFLVVGFRDDVSEGGEVAAGAFLWPYFLALILWEGAKSLHTKVRK